MRVKAMRVIALLVLGTAAMAGVGASCGDSDGDTTPRPIQRPDPTLRLLVITDLEGYLAPCGCNTRPLGGIDRMAAKVQEVRRRGQPTVLIAAGDLFFGNEDHGVRAEGADTQELWKSELIVDIFDRMNLTAATPGHLDLTHGLAHLRALETEADFPLLVADVSIRPNGDGLNPLNLPSENGTENGTQNGAENGADNPSPLFSPTLLTEVAGVKLGFFGVSQLESETGALPEGVSREAPLPDAARAAVRELSAAGAELIVAMVRGSRRDARQVGALDGVDFVIQGGLDQGDAIPPVDVDGSFLLHAGHQGQGLLVVDVFRRNDGDFTDWSDWTIDVEREHIEARIADLRARLAEWESDDSVDQADVQRQRQRVERMEQTLARLRPPATVAGNAFRAEWLELPQDAPRDAAVTRLLSAYDRRVNQENARIFANLVPEPAREGAPHYVGSASCAGSDCHQAANDWWSTHPHGRAYATLVNLDKQFNLSCVGCHVTGYMKPGGSTVTHNGDGALVNVGCESCHGPGSAHVADPERDGLIALETPETVCVGCHNPEHSDRFVYDAFINMILVPGHGRPAND